MSVCRRLDHPRSRGPSYSRCSEIEDSLLQHNDHDSVNTNIQNREPSKKTHNNHLTNDIIGYLEVSVRMRGVPRVNYREMIGLSHGFYTSTIEPQNYKEALNDEF